MKIYKTKEEAERAHQADMKFLAAMAEVRNNSTQEPSELQNARARLKKTLSGKDEPPFSEAELKAAAKRFAEANENRGGPELRAARARLRATLSGHETDTEDSSQAYKESGVKSNLSRFFLDPSSIEILKRGDETSSEVIKEDGTNEEYWREASDEAVEQIRKSRLADARRKLRRTLSQRQLNEERL
jgi:hypothetical protein